MPSDDITEIQKGQLLTEKEYQRHASEKYEDDFQAGMGAEAIKKLLAESTLRSCPTQLREDLENATGQKRARILKRLEVVEALRISGNRPEWMILEVLPGDSARHPARWFSLTAAVSRPPTSTTCTAA